MITPTSLPDFDELHQAIRDVYRDAMQRQGNSAKAFDEAVEIAADRLQREIDHRGVDLGDEDADAQGDQREPAPALGRRCVALLLRDLAFWLDALHCAVPKRRYATSLSMAGM